MIRLWMLVLSMNVHGEPQDFAVETAMSADRCLEIVSSNPSLALRCERDYHVIGIEAKDEEEFDD